MSKFDWDSLPDAEPAPTAAPLAPTNFDWDSAPDVDQQSVMVPSEDPLASLPSTEEQDLANISATESFLRSGAQIPTMGFADEITGAVKAGWDVATTDKELDDLKTLYGAYRDAERRKNDLAAKANPKASMAGTAAGVIGTALIPGLNAVNTVRGAATLGALSGVGSSESDLLQGEVGGVAKDATIGSVFGGVTQGAANKIGKFFKGYKDGIATSAKKNMDNAAVGAFGSLTPTPKEMGSLQKALRTGAEAAETSLDDVSGEGFEFAAAHAGDADISLPELAKKYTFVRGGPERTIEEVTKRINQIEADKLPFFERAEQYLADLPVDKQNLLPHLRSKLDEIASTIAKNDRGVIGKEAKEALYKQLRGMFDDYLSPLEGFKDGVAVAGKARNTHNIADLDQIKREIGKELSPRGFDKAAKIATGQISPDALTQANRAAYTALKNHITEVGDLVGGDVGSTIRRLNQEESVLIGIKEIAEKASAKAANQQGLGMGGGVAMSMGGSAGFALGGPIGAGIGSIGALAAKSGVENVLGQSIPAAAKVAMSKSRARAGEFLGKYAKQVEKLDPALQTVGTLAQDVASPGTAQYVAQNSPFRGKDSENSTNLATYDDSRLGGVAGALTASEDKQLKGYGENLTKALQSGDVQSKNAAIFLIMQNPKARAALGLTNKK